MSEGLHVSWWACNVLGETYADNKLRGVDEVVVEDGVEHCGTQFACGACES